jgi:hypothetical protein
MEAVRMIDHKSLLVSMLLNLLCPFFIYVHNKLECLSVVTRSSLI